jgi:hypothetical protein
MPSECSTLVRRTFFIPPGKTESERGEETIQKTPSYINPFSSFTFTEEDGGLTLEDIQKEVTIATLSISPVENKCR